MLRGADQASIHIPAKFLYKVKVLQEWESRDSSDFKNKDEKIK